MRDITELPVSIKQVLDEDERLCKEIASLMMSDIDGKMSEVEVTLRARLRQIRSVVRDMLDPEKKYSVSTAASSDDEKEGDDS